MWCGAYRPPVLGTIPALGKEALRGEGKREPPVLRGAIPYLVAGDAVGLIDKQYTDDATLVSFESV